jgi:predicted CopG family antitoxin
MCMATKTISIMEDAYRLLAERKKPNESFSEVIRREFGVRKDFMALAGAWRGVSNKGIRMIKSEIRELKKRSRTELVA